MLKYIFVMLCFSLFYVGCNSIQEYGDGKALYGRYCENCHIDDGTGLGGLIPPLGGADLLQKAGAEAACWVHKGLKGKIVVNGKEYEGEMPAQPKLSNIELTNILNYINNSWGNTRDFITVKEVDEALESCK